MKKHRACMFYNFYSHYTSNIIDFKERERERERDRDRQTDRQTNKQRDRDRESHNGSCIKTKIFL